MDGLTATHKLQSLVQTKLCITRLPDSTQKMSQGGGRVSILRCARQNCPRGSLHTLVCVYAGFNALERAPGAWAQGLPVKNISRFLCRGICVEAPLVKLVRSGSCRHRRSPETPHGDHAWW